MAAAGDILKDGQWVHASWVPALKPRNTMPENDDLKHGRMPAGWENQPHKLRLRDRDATWNRKNQHWVYGDKNHVHVDRCDKLIMRFAVTTTSTHDPIPFESIVMPITTSRGVWADRSYSAAEVEAWRHHRGYDNPIIRRTTGNTRMMSANGRRINAACGCVPGSSMGSAPSAVSWAARRSVSLV